MRHSDKTVTGNSVWLYTFIVIYLILYTCSSIWLLFEGWINQFAALHSIWNIPDGSQLPEYVQLAITTALGSILGGAILSFSSFHRYIAVEKSFESEHAWGFLVMPFLSIITGLVIYSLVQGGLLVLSGSMSTKGTPQSAQLGFTAIGCISGYNWDKVAAQLQKLSKKVLTNQQDTNSKKQNET